LEGPTYSIAKYQIQYQLIVDSPGGLGNPHGSDYYNASSTAQFSITSPVGFLVQEVVQWEGDYTGDAAVGSVVMDRPKTIHAVWTTSYTQLYLLLGGIGGVAAVGVFLRKRKARHAVLQQVPRPAPEVYREQWYRLGFLCDTGRVRSNNEDSVLVIEALCSFESAARARILCAVADGVGGSQKGEVASRLNLQTLSARASEWMVQTKGFDLAGSLRSAIESANDVLVKYGMEHPESEGFASTVVAALIDGDMAYVAHAGDSRAYLVNREKIEQLTRDHSQVQELVDSGRITAEQAIGYPGRNVITRAVGAATDLKVDLSQALILAPVDVLVLCTDGLWDLVRKEEIQQIVLQTSDPQDACRKLVSLANERGGKDNISVVIVQCQAPPDSSLLG
jgi:protein phosphatase